MKLSIMKYNLVTFNYFYQVIIINVIFYTGEFPWMVAVLKKVDIFGMNANVYLCGGSLIHP